MRRIAPYVLDREKQARTVDVEVEWIDSKAGEGLLAGYSADVEIVLDARDPVLKVPTEAVLEGAPLDDERIALAARAAEQEITPISDVRASAWYRRELIHDLTQRLLRDVRRRDD